MGTEEYAASLVGTTLQMRGASGGVGGSPLYTVLGAEGEWVRVERHHNGGLLDSVYIWHADAVRGAVRVA